MRPLARRLGWVAFAAALVLPPGASGAPPHCANGVRHAAPFPAVIQGGPTLGPISLAVGPGWRDGLEGFHETADGALATRVFVVVAAAPGTRLALTVAGPRPDAARFTHFSRDDTWAHAKAHHALRLPHRANARTEPAVIHGEVLLRDARRFALTFRVGRDRVGPFCLRLAEPARRASRR